MLITLRRRGFDAPVYMIEGLEEDDYNRLCRGLYEINTDKDVDKLLRTLLGMRRYA